MTRALLVAAILAGPLASEPQLATRPSDFDGDGKSVILWRSTSTGQV